MNQAKYCQSREQSHQLKWRFSTVQTRQYLSITIAKPVPELRIGSLWLGRLFSAF